MPAIPQFELNRTNSYPGDTLSELVRQHNLHDHALVTSGNFLALPVAIDATVGFVGIAGNADPFNGQTDPLPLTVVGIDSLGLTLSRPATADAIGFLSFISQVTGAYQTRSNLQVTSGSDRVITASAEPNGYLDSASLDRLAKRDVLIETLFVPAVGQPPELPAIIDINIGLDSNGFFVNLTELGPPNPTITLVRGALYRFNLSPAVVAAGSFEIVTDLRDPATGLDRYPFGVSTPSTSHVVFNIPLDAPAQLFYQSRSSPYVYGELSISGGTVNPSSPLITAWQSASPIVPLTTPSRVILVKLGSSGAYRLTNWRLFPSWLASAVDRDCFVQLRYTLDEISIYPLSTLIRVQTVGLVELTLSLSPILLPPNAIITCAVYGTRNLESLVQQLTSVEVIS